MSLRILIPQAATNYIRNPAFRYDTTDWNTEGAALTRTLTRARFGVASGQVVTTGAALHEGVFFRVAALEDISDMLTASIYVRGAGTVRIRIDDNAPGGGEYVSDSLQLTDSRWQRIEVSGRSHGGDDIRLYVETDEESAVVRTFYIDGAQLERYSEATSYCDGDQEGCRWDGIFHDSSSQRPGSTRAGGRWMELSGPTRESEDLYMTVTEGLGMAPITNNNQSYALAAGGYHQNIKIQMRAISLTFHAKHKVDGDADPVSLEYLHNLRQTLIDTVKPDRTGGDEDIWFEYQEGAVPMYFRARYNGGLEGNWDVRNMFINSFPLKLLSVSPLMSEDSQEAVELDFQDTFDSNYIAGRIDGQWQNLNYGFNDRLADFGLAEGARGEIYALALDNGLTVANNNAGAVDPLLSVRALVQWNGESWSQIGPTTAMGGAGSLSCLTVHPNGDVYVGGLFSSIGGVAANNIARWDGSNWNALGSGVNGLVYTIAIAPNGDLFVGGIFSTAGGLNRNKIARWDGSTWHACGTYGGLNNNVHAIAISQDGGTVYVGGEFTDENGNPGSNLNRVASYNVIATTFAAMGNGFDDGIVHKLYLAPTADLYAGGSFTLSGGDSMPALSKFSGGSWTNLGGSIIPGSDGSNYGLLAVVYSIDTFESNSIIVGGVISSVGNFQQNIVLTVWNGSTWHLLDAQQSDAETPNMSYPLFTTSKGDIITGFTTARQILCAGINTVNNPGSANCQPRFFVRGPCRLRWIENQTTHHRMLFNLILLDGEELTIDTGRATMTSNIRRNMLYGILASSDFSNFSLAPGDNTLAIFMYDDQAAGIGIQFTPQHWGVDAGGNQT